MFVDVQDSLPQTLANLEIVIDMLKRYHKGVEQALVILPQGAAVGAGGAAPSTPARRLLRPRALSINQPPPCLTGFLPASEWRSPADTSVSAAAVGHVLQDPEGHSGQRGARCAQLSRASTCPGKRAATPQECRSNEPYVPLGTNPWYGDPNQILNCPAPAARCDQPVKPGLRSSRRRRSTTGMNPLPADLLPPASRRPGQ